MRATTAVGGDEMKRRVFLADLSQEEDSARSLHFRREAS
jgi:hypothetical protein